MLRKCLPLLLALTAALPGSATAAPAMSATGECTWAGVLRPTERLDFVFGGAAVADSPATANFTYIKCTLVGAFGNTASCESLQPGPAASCVGTALNWPVAPVTITMQAWSV